MSLFDYSNKSDAEDLITISGHVKWFDAAKGYALAMQKAGAELQLKAYTDERVAAEEEMAGEALERELTELTNWLLALGDAVGEAPGIGLLPAEGRVEHDGRRPDLLRELEATSGRDLATWSKLWLETAGVNTLRPVVEVDELEGPAEVGVLGPVADVLLGKASQQVPGGRFDREAQ